MQLGRVLLQDCGQDVDASQGCTYLKACLGLRDPLANSFRWLAGELTPSPHGPIHRMAHDLAAGFLHGK